LVIALGVGVTLGNVAAVSAPAATQDRSQQRRGVDKMQKDFVNALAMGGGLLVVAQWEAKPGEAEKIADTLRRFLPQAQSEPGVKLFLISRGKDKPAQFLFYELFADEAAFAAHQASEHFKTLIAGEAVPLLSKRERALYQLL
jgi:quinol monooxygenase YgiN